MDAQLETWIEAGEVNKIANIVREECSILALPRMQAFLTELAERAYWDTESMSHQEVESRRVAKQRLQTDKGIYAADYTPADHHARKRDSNPCFSHDHAFAI
jgi:hypothetical protein